MSLMKSATRRLSLLAGSSLIAASLSAVSFTAATLSPTTAYAYDECVPANPPTTLSDGPDGVSDPTLNGPTPDSFTCTGPTAYQTTGITYTSAGNLAVGVVGGINVGTVGVNLTAGGSDNVNFSSSGEFQAQGVTGTSGAAIDVRSAAGDIVIQTGNVDASTQASTHGIYAQSTGGGDISISRTQGQVRNVTFSSTSAQVAAIEAVTNGGNIAITTGGNSTTGDRRGIRAITDGAGAVNLTINSGVQTDFSFGVAALDLSAGTGGINVQINSGTVAGALGSTGVAIIANSTGNVLINQTGGNVLGAIVANSTGGAVTFNSQSTSPNTDGWTIRGATVFGGGNDRINLTGTGRNTLDPGASIDMGAGADIFTLASTLNAKVSTISLGAGDDTLNVSGFLNTNGTTIDFGSGNDTFNLSGRLSMNNLTLLGLENFNNSGVILMGLGVIPGLANPDDPSNTDRLGNDILRLSSGTFTGSGSGRVVMDVLLGAGTQVGCETPTGQADCLDFRGASTDGVTTLTVLNYSTASQVGAFDPSGITLVDVGGAGTSAAGHFVLDPNSPGYVDDPLVGGSIQLPGLFRYTLQYDPETQRHVLVGLPGREALEYAVLSGAAQSIWHMTTETVTDRQTDLRQGAEEGSLWFRSAGEYTKRDIETGFDSFGQTFASDNSYKLYAGVLMVGADLLTGQTGQFNHVLGFQAGYVSSSMELTGSESSARFTGGMGGVYGSLWNDWFFLNGTVNVNGVTLDYDAPALTSKTTTFVNSVGAAAEAGTHTAITENTFIEPLVAASWVRTSFEEISLQGGEVEPGDAESARVALGLRLGGTLPGQNVSATYFVTGRGWYEFEGESAGLLHNPGVDMPFADELTGAFGEAEAGISVFNAANTLSGFLTSGVKWKDGYSAVNLSLGVRMAW